MPRLLTYDGKPVALIEFLPNNAFGKLPEHAERVLCERISPDNGAPDVIYVSEEKADKLRAGELVELNPWYCQNCLHRADEMEFVSSDGDPAPHICPKCGSTECFSKDDAEEDDAEEDD